MSVFSIEAYNALYKSSGLADLSLRGKIRVTGKDRRTVLQRLLTQDLRPLQNGDGRPSALLSARGKVLSLMNVLVFENALVLDTDENCAPAALSSLEKLIITEDAVLNLESGLSHFLIQGPASAEILKTAGIPLPASPDASFHYTSFLKDSKECFAVRTELNTFEFWTSSEAAGSVQNLLYDAGQTQGIKPVNALTWNVFRIERGLLRYGIDVTEEVTLPETGLDKALACDTKGCYPGQEVVARTNTYKGHARKLRALKLAGPEIPAPGSRISCGEADAGWVTSACFSPKQNCVLALAYLNRNFFETGQDREFEIDGKKTQSRIVSLEELRNFT